MCRRTTLLAKISARLVETPGPLDTPCQIWTGADSGNGRGGGYGRLDFDGGKLAVHIAVWVCHHGPIPSKKQIDHRCRNRRCAAEDHLELVTHRQNQKRRAAHARQAKG